MLLLMCLEMTIMEKCMFDSYGGCYRIAHLSSFEIMSKRNFFMHLLNKAD